MDFLIDTNILSEAEGEAADVDIVPICSCFLVKVTIDSL